MLTIRSSVARSSLTPAASGRAFPSEINTAQAAIAFVRSLDPETRAKLHWRVAASALNGLAAGQGSFDQAGRAMRHALATEGWLVNKSVASKKSKARRRKKR